MSGKVHIRRCHLCHELSESHNKPVQHCHHCGKALAPFFYFNEEQITVLSEDGLRPPLIEGEYAPVYGLVACWDEVSW